MIISKVANGITTIWHNGQKPLRAVMTNSSETFTNDAGEKFVLDYIQGKVSKVIKYYSDSSIAYIKTYTRDGDTLTVQIQKPDSKNKLITDRVLERAKDYIAEYTGENKTLEKYYKKFDNIWKELIDYILKDSVRQIRTRTMYLEYGQDINKFLRNGEFSNSQYIINNPNAPDFIKLQTKEKQTVNRQIIDAIPEIDKATHSSHTTRTMTVYRDAPVAWLKSAKDGKLTDRGYCSTSTEPGASFEGLIGSEPKMRYEIELSEGTPYWDLTDTMEKEMLIPRNGIYQNLGNGKLRLIGFLKD